MFDRHPRVIIQAEQVADVIAGVNFARDAGLDLSVRGGGHSAPGFGTNDDGVVLDLSLMRDVHVDPRARTARAGGGATWGDFNYATHAYGLATTGGIVSTTGIGGLTLGGGIGYLTRGYGLSIDNLVSAEVVTADGQVRNASATDNADLFWAIRGGGGNFGVVTSFEFQLHPIDDVYVGLFFYELEHAGTLLRFFREFIPNAPEAYGAFPAFQIAPPLEFIPADRHGDTFCLAVVHWAGPLDEGENAMKPFRDLAPVVAEMVGPMPYPALNAAFDPIFPKGHPQLLEGQLRHRAHRRRHRGAPRTTARRCPRSVPPCTCTRSTARATASAPTDTAFAYRDATFATVIVCAWQDPAVDAERIQWVRDYYQATRPALRSRAATSTSWPTTTRPGSRTTTARTTPGSPKSNAPTTRTTCSTSTRTSRPPPSCHGVRR